MPARNKAGFVENTVRSLLEQTYPCHIVLSDQGSTDGTMQIIRELALSYRGPHKVTVLSCPETEPKGMRGMNAHLDWIMSQIEEDVVLITSADDLLKPERTAKVVEAFEKHKPDMVLTGLLFMDPDGTYMGSTAHDQADGLLDPELCLTNLVGGSTSHAMTREFYEAVGGFGGICGFDAYMPFLATIRKGAWFIKEPLHVYVRHVDPENTGLEGAYRAGDENKKMQLEELMHFQVQTSYLHAIQTMDEWGVDNERVKMTLLNEILGRAAAWSRVRERMTIAGVAPLPLKA